MYLYKNVMPYYEVQLQIDADIAEAVEALIQKYRPTSMSFIDAGDVPILEPELNTTPLWPHTIISALFSSSQRLDKMITVLQKAFGEKISVLKNEMLPEKNWQEEWKQYAKPQLFAERLWICPSHLAAVDERPTLFLDAGLAFGSGAHPTTMLCLQFLASYDLTGKIVIDYGSGSGILGLAALKLGAQKVYAVDHDPQARESSLNNARANAISEKSYVVLSPLEADTLGPIADILIANILAEPLIMLAPRLEALVKPDGQLALSGILQSEYTKVMAAYTCTFAPPQFQEEWVLLHS
jgi:ribosomal protein L11 methyltransferase